MTILTGELMRLVIDEIWNGGEIELADELFTDDYVNHGGLIPDILRGSEAIKLSVALYRSAYPTFRLKIADVTTDKGAIVLRWVAYCRPPSMDEPHENKRDLRGITRCRLHNGKIAESWTAWDSRAGLTRFNAVTRSLTLGVDDEAGRRH